jgi:hypothetical protein
MIRTLTLAELTDEALRLPGHDQLRLARTLLERSEAGGDMDVHAAWENEIESRIKLLDSGLAKGRPFVDVIQGIDRQLGR